MLFLMLLLNVSRVSRTCGPVKPSPALGHLRGCRRSCAIASRPVNNTLLGLPCYAIRFFCTHSSDPGLNLRFNDLLEITERAAVIRAYVADAPVLNDKRSDRRGGGALQR